VAEDGFCGRFYVEVKTFELLVVEGAFVLWPKQRRMGLPCVPFLGIVCTAWLKSTVEELAHIFETK
jgi:hypothetical protein